LKREGEIVVYVITYGLINEDCLSSSPSCSIVQLAVAGQSEGSDRTERLTPPPTTLINYLLRFYILFSPILSSFLLSSILLPLYSSSTLCPCPLCSPTFHHTHSIFLLSSQYLYPPSSLLPSPLSSSPPLLFYPTLPLISLLYQEPYLCCALPAPSQQGSTSQLTESSSGECGADLESRFLLCIPYTSPRRESIQCIDSKLRHLIHSFLFCFLGASKGAKDGKQGSYRV
jgi:hypothetical protein